MDYTPRIPVELCQDVFELAASTDTGSARSLALVSKIVRLWTQPLLDEFVILPNSPTCVSLFSKAVQRAAVAQRVRVLDVRTGPADFYAEHNIALFAACSNVEVLSATLYHVPIMYTMPHLTHLRLQFNEKEALCGFQNVLPETLTHLECVSHPSHMLASLFYNSDNIFKHIFYRCPSMECLVLTADHLLALAFTSFVFVERICALETSLKHVILRSVEETPDKMYWTQISESLNRLVDATMKMKGPAVVCVSADEALRGGKIDGLLVYEEERDPSSDWAHGWNDDINVWRVAEQFAKDREERRKAAGETEDESDDEDDE